MGTSSSTAPTRRPSNEVLIVRGVSAEMFSKNEDCEACRDTRIAARNEEKRETSKGAMRVVARNAQSVAIAVKSDTAKSSRDSRRGRNAIVVKEAVKDARIIREDSENSNCFLETLIKIGMRPMVTGKGRAISLDVTFRWKDRNWSQ